MALEPEELLKRARRNIFGDPLPGHQGWEHQPRGYHGRWIVGMHVAQRKVGGNHGRIVELLPGQKVKVRTPSGHLRHWAFHNIRELRQHDPRRPTPPSIGPGEAAHRARFPGNRNEDIGDAMAGEFARGEARFQNVVAGRRGAFASEGQSARRDIGRALLGDRLGEWRPVGAAEHNFQRAMRAYQPRVITYRQILQGAEEGDMGHYEIKQRDGRVEAVHVWVDDNGHPYIAASVAGGRPPRQRDPTLPPTPVPEKPREAVFEPVEPYALQTVPRKPFSNPGAPDWMIEGDIEGGHLNAGSGNHMNVVRLGNIDGKKVVLKSTEAAQTARDGIPRKQDGIREIMATELGPRFGVRTPRMVIRMHDGEEKTVQQFIPGKNYRLKPIEVPRKDAMRAAVFDSVIGNTDRHNGNYRSGVDNKVWLVDHGLSFPETESSAQNAFIETLEGQRYDEEMKTALINFISDRASIERRMLELGFAQAAIDRMFDRAALTLALGKIPSMEALGIPKGGFIQDWRVQVGP